MVFVQPCIGAPATTSWTAPAPTGRDCRLHCTATRSGRFPTIRSTPQSPVTAVMITGTPQPRAIRATWSSNSMPVIADSAAASRGPGVNAPLTVASRNRGVAASSYRCDEPDGDAPGDAHAEQMSAPHPMRSRRPRSTFVLRAHHEANGRSARRQAAVVDKAVGVSVGGRTPGRDAVDTARLAPGRRIAHRVPETSYASCGDLSLAYQVFGDGPVELVFGGTVVGEHRRRPPHHV